VVEPRTIALHVEVDVDPTTIDEVVAGSEWQGEGPYEGLAIEMGSVAGHGFGLSEILTIVVSVGVTASADLISEAVRTAVKGVVRRAKPADDGSDSEQEDQLYSSDLVAAIEEALRRAERTRAPESDD